MNWAAPRLRQHSASTVTPDHTSADLTGHRTTRTQAPVGDACNVVTESKGFHDKGFERPLAIFFLFPEHPAKPSVSEIGLLLYSWVPACTGAGRLWGPDAEYSQFRNKRSEEERMGWGRGGAGRTRALLPGNRIHVTGRLEPGTKTCPQDTPCTLSPRHPGNFSDINGPSLILIHILNIQKWKPSKGWHLSHQSRSNRTTQRPFHSLGECALFWRAILCWSGKLQINLQIICGQ